jgi:16S rRNA processing protein RimM
MPAGGPIPAGRVGRPHGLDGSFYVAHAVPRLLRAGAEILLGGDRPKKIARRSGTEQRPIVRLEGIDDREAIEALRGEALEVSRDYAPALQEGEWWAGDLEGCSIRDGERPVGVVRRLIELPSCEALEVLTDPPERGPLLVPMVSDAVRSVDVEAGTIDVDMSFIGLDG